jgi:hypothetical protein
MEAWMPHAIEGGRLLWQMIPASNPSVGATLVADDGLVNMTPQVRVDLGDQVRRAVYLPAHAIQEGPVVVTRMSPALDAPYIVEITNYQASGAAPVGSAGPILFGEPATNASPTPDADWTEGDGAMLPMPIGEVPS